MRSIRLSARTDPRLLSSRITKAQRPSTRFPPRVAPGAIGASLAISLLEILVAFIQAYVFAFLTALFIGTAVHPH